MHPMSTPARPRVALVFGGRSSEHAISCVTAASVLTHIDRERWDVVPIGISPQGHWVLMPDDAAALQITDRRLPQVPESDATVVLPLQRGESALRRVEAGEVPTELGDVDVVFPLLHGPFGEDGSLQGLLDLADLHYVGCGITSSAIMMDKAYMKTVFAAAGLPQVPWVTITDRRWRHDREGALAAVRELELPVFVKPCRAGSSVGVTRVTAWEQLEDAVEAARREDPKVIVEQGVVGAREVECGVLDGHDGAPPRVSPVGEIVASADFYDFEAKYLDAATQIQCPADLPADVADRLRAMALVAYDAADGEGLSRVDFFYTRDGELLINEINTMPGFTPASMYPRVWQEAGLTYSELIDELLTLALERPTGLR